MIHVRLQEPTQRHVFNMLGWGKRVGCVVPVMRACDAFEGFEFVGFFIILQAFDEEFSLVDP